MNTSECSPIIPMSSPQNTSDEEVSIHDDDSISLDNLPRLGFTENNSVTYLSSGNPCLDFFFHVVPDTPPEGVVSRLQSSWNHNPLTTLKLVCNLRGVRGTGKSDKENFYTAALWLHSHHPKTFACNVPLLVEFGYFKDLLEILYRLLEGPDVRQIAKSEWNFKKSVKGKGEIRKQYFLAKKKMKMMNKKRDDEMKATLRASIPREQRIEANRAQMKAEQNRAKASRREKLLAMAEKAQNRYNSDADYKLLHDQISYFFADRLTSDLQSLNSGESGKISLAAKWCPSIGSSYDNATLICESIARIIYPRDSDPEFDRIGEADYVMKIKNRLRKQILVPLHTALKLPEVYMSAKQWSSIPYDRVASIAMKNYTNIFLHRDNSRFRDYLKDVTAGHAKIAAGALLPHEIIKSLDKGSGETMVAELQWNRIVDDLSQKGKLTNCIAVCDVSASMTGTPMEVAVALGLLVSEVAAEPWKGHVITFSQSPELHLIKGGNLKSKTEFIRKMDWGFNTDFQKVFDKMLEVAVNKKLREDEMVQRVFVFSDMEFDVAYGSGYRNPPPGYVNSPPVYGNPPVPDYGNPPPFYGNPPPVYGNPPPFYGNPPPVYVTPPPVYGNPPVPDYGNPPPVYGNPPPRYVTPPPVYGNPPVPDYGNPPPFYGNPPPRYVTPPPVYGNPPVPDYGNPPPVYGNRPTVYGNPPVYVNPPPGYVNPPVPNFSNPPPVYSIPPPGYGNLPPVYVNPPPFYGNPPVPNYGNPPPVYGNPPPGYGYPQMSGRGARDTEMEYRDPWETDYEAIERKFKACGYDKVPEIVFWNLRDSKSTPVTAGKKGVALLSGFSKNLLTLFLEEGGVIKQEDVVESGDVKKERLSPEDRMEAAISGELYQKLVVCD